MGLFTYHVKNTNYTATEVLKLLNGDSWTHSTLAKDDPYYSLGSTLEKLALPLGVAAVAIATIAIVNSANNQKEQSNNGDNAGNLRGNEAAPPTYSASVNHETSAPSFEPGEATKLPAYNPHSEGYEAAPPAYNPNNEYQGPGYDVPSQAYYAQPVYQAQPIQPVYVAPSSVFVPSVVHHHHYYDNNAYVPPVVHHYHEAVPASAPQYKITDIKSNAYSGKEVTYLLNGGDKWLFLNHQIPEDYIVPTAGTNRFFDWNYAVLDL